MNRRTHCMFCGNPIPQPAQRGGWWEVRCAVCEPYLVSDSAFSDQFHPDVQPYLVSAWLRWSTLQRNELPQVNTYRIEEVCRDTPRYRPAEKADRLLLAIGMQSKHPGFVVQMSTEQRVPLAWAYNSAEADQYYAWLQESNFTKPGQGGPLLTKAGWERYEYLQTRGGRNASRRAFVAMWFHDSMDDAWKHGLMPGIADADFEPYRVKGAAQSERIDAHVIAEIRGCRFVVADATGARPNVYYEAGFAEGLQIPVIWTCRRSAESTLSFDTRQFPHILWGEPEDLRRQLTDRIRAVIF